MADGTVPTQSGADSAGVPNSLIRKMRDMGDGTFAEVVALGTGTAATSVQGTAAQDAPVVGNPVLVGGRASAAAPADVSADGDAVDAWHLRNGAQVTQISYAGILASAGSGVVGTGTQRVTLATDVALPTGTNAIGTVTAVGAAADGAAVSGNPVRIAGKDGSGNTQDLITDTTGNLSVGTGTAGTSASNVVTVQGIASGTPVVVGGAVASGATDSGNPTKVGAVFNSTQPTVTTGQRVDLQADARGNLQARIVGNGISDADAITNAPSLVGNATDTSARGLAVFPYGWNGTNRDRLRAGITTPSATITGYQNTLPWAIYNAAPTTRTEAQGGPLQATANGSLVIRPFAVPDRDWSYAAATGGISNTTAAVTVAASAGAGLRNYITGIQLSSDALGAATEFAVRDGAGGAVLWRMKIGTAGLVGGIDITFPTPLKSTASTLLEVVTLTASITGAVFVNVQGFVGA